MKAEKPRAMVVAGVMSGTSADGVDVALARIAPSRTGPRVELLEHRGFPYPRALRSAVLRAMDADAVSVAELSRLHWRLGSVFADCVDETCTHAGLAAELVGMHGQTIFHQGRAAVYLGERLRTTWQLGEAAVVRERLGVPVVSDFRPTDMAAGGQGAPLVPMLDWCAYRSRKFSRVLLNLGGIANLTVLPKGCNAASVTAFDTGPANMVVDGLMMRLYGRAYDDSGGVAARGTAISSVVRTLLAMPYFAAAPPKSCGREQFGERFTERLLKLCEKAQPTDIVRTATEITVLSVARAVQRFAGDATEVLAAGGGVRNLLLMRRLDEELPNQRVTVMEAPQAKEAVAFALLGWLTWFGQAGNLPSATGASGGRVLGKISW